MVVKGELLMVTPVGNLVEIASLADGKTHRESTVTARGEVLGVRMATSGGRLWLGIETCEGNVVHDDLAFCEGTPNVSVYAGAPDEPKLAADVSKQAAPAAVADRLQAMAPHRGGVVVTVSPTVSKAANDVKRLIVTDEAVTPLPNDDSLGELCSSQGALYSLTSTPNTEQFKNEGFDLRHLTASGWESIPLPTDLSAQSYNLQLACADSTVDLVFSQAGRAELYHLNESDKLQPIKLASQAPIDIHADWSIDSAVVLGQVAESGAMTAVLFDDPVVEVDLETDIASNEQRPAFVGQIGGSLYIGKMIGTTLEVRRG